MANRYGLGWVALSLLLSALTMLVAGVNGNVTVHWRAGGEPDMAVRAWIVAAVFPGALITLLTLTAGGGTSRLIGRSPGRTVAVIALVLTATQMFVLRRLFSSGQDPLSFALLLVGAILAVTGNFWAKDVPDAADQHAGGRRRVAGVLFVLGLLLMAVGAIVGVAR